MEYRATRDAFGDALVLFGEDNKNVVVLDCDLADATKTRSFRDKYPDRHYEFGIQEANPLSVAAGMSLLGDRPFVVSFACFLPSRYDQVRVSIAQEKAPVVIVGTHGGLAIGKDGATHMGLEDIGLMRGLPGISVIQPVDYYETFQVVRYLIDSTKPVYLRLGRQPLPIINKPDYVFNFGQGVQLKEGNDLAVFATGGMVHLALDAANNLKEEGINIRVVNIHTIKPLDRGIVEEAIDETCGLLTVEDHNIINGLGSAISEVLAEYGKGRLKRLGIKDVFGESGAPDDLYRKHGLDKESLIVEFREFCNQV